MPTRVSGSGLRRWFALAAALYLLNLALSFHNLWPTPWVEDRHEFSVEIALLILALALWAEVRGPPSRGALIGLALLLTLAAFGRYAEVTAPALYGRPVNLYWDAPHLPKVAAMLIEAAPGWLLAAGIAGLALLPPLVFGLLAWALRQVGRALEAPLARRGMAVSAGLLTVLYLGGHASDRLETESWFSLPVSKTYADQAGFLLAALAGEGKAKSLPPSPTVASDLGRVGDAHLVVLFLESYGATTYDRPEVAEALAASRADLDAALAQTGRAAVSAFVLSPTFGGNSWLAHASLMAGIEVRDSDAYDLLLTQERDTLVHRFKRQGYRTLAVMPGLRQDWPEGAFYGFDAIYGAQALDYRGPEFGWWRIPDQFALAKLDTLELAAAGPPRFVFFPTISTHVPFRPTPPFQPDWERMLTPEPFGEAAYRAALAQSSKWTDLGPAYADSVAYALTYLAAYLRHRSRMDLVLVVLGDHQPSSSVSGEGASWEVPVHAIASRSDILDGLVATGFGRGMTPRRPAVGPMHGLYGALLRAFDAGAAAAGPGESGLGVSQPGVPRDPGEEATDTGRAEPAG